MRTINLISPLTIEKNDLNEHPGIKLNEGIIHEINLLQTGGSFNENPTFDNSGIKDLIENINQVHEFIIKAFMYQNECEIEPGNVLKQLSNLMELKDHLTGLKAPEPGIN